MKPGIGLLAVLWLASPAWAQGAVWKASGEIGLTRFDAELDDAAQPTSVLLRIENHSRLDKLTVTPRFVRLADQKNLPLRRISADEVVSDYLDQVYRLLPRHARDLDALLGDIQADFPQQKIVEVVSRLNRYLAQGSPVSWRAQVENFLLGRPASDPEDFAQAAELVKRIQFVAENYFWPNDIPPDTQVIGMVFFERPSAMPVRIFFQIGDQYIGTEMKPARDSARRGGS